MRIPRGSPGAAHRFVDVPVAALADLVDQSHAFWVRFALAPWWPRMAAFLENEIANSGRGDS